MVYAVPYNPDGTPVRRRKGRLVVAEGRDTHRAQLTCGRAWWTRKGEPKPVPVGATIHIGLVVKPHVDVDSGILMVRPPGQPARKVRDDDLIDPSGRVFFGSLAFRCERVPVVDPETDEVIGLREKWVDVQEQEQAAAAARELEEARRAHRAKRAGKAPKAAE